MKRETNMLAIVVLLLGLATVGFAQELDNQPRPDFTSGVLGAQLIAWSEMQELQPVQQPAPKPVPPPEQQPEQPRPDQQQSGQAAGAPSSPQSSVRTLTGTIIKDGDVYVLKTETATYQLDDQKKAKQYAGQQVKVVGTLDPSSKLIRIETLELIS
jgi:hypothetical protein